MNEVLKTMAKRSSARAYTDEKLTDNEIKALITAALQAPTARNMQEVHVSVVDGDNPILKEIDTLCKSGMIANSPDEETKARIESNPNNFYYGAPTVFILSADKDFKWSKLDSGIAAENISLAAESLGLGSLIIGIIDDTLRGEKKDYFAKVLHFPENFEFAIAVAAGHKNTEKEPHKIDFDKSVSFV
ncbi:MAG: nitroreductase family protein [Oscillospiraceae bacterium]|nr:nitroreductase family protein [Oscillospiraceae bacterium]